MREIIAKTINLAVLSDISMVIYALYLNPNFTNWYYIAIELSR